MAAMMSGALPLLKAVAQNAPQPLLCKVTALHHWRSRGSYWGCEEKSTNRPEAQRKGPVSYVCSLF